jgi:integrase
MSRSRPLTLTPCYLRLSTQTIDIYQKEMDKLYARDSSSTPDFAAKCFQYASRNRGSKMAKLTKRVVDALTTREKDYFVFDEEVMGFGIRVLPSGKKTYIAQYRSGGRTRRVKIGRATVLTPDEARARAKELLGDVAKGENPAEGISAHRQAPTVSQICDRFYAVHVTQHCKPSTQAEYKRSLEIFVKPVLGTFKIGDVKRADISEFHHGLRDRPYQANRVLGVLSKMFNLTEVWGLRPDGSNPCRHVIKFKEHRRETILTQTQSVKLAQILDELSQDASESPFAIAAIRLLMLTGCRLGEIQTLKWEYLREGMMILPDSKTGRRHIPLPPMVKDVLAAVPRLPENPYVIAGEVEGQHLTDLQRPWRRIRKLAGLEHVRIHDLRHTYASHALASGLDLVMVGKLLGHSQYQTTMRYIHLQDGQIREAAARVTDGMQFMLSPAPPPRTPYLRIVK